ncbi:eCIS core domain-containing protein [Niabella aquatica]
MFTTAEKTNHSSAVQQKAAQPAFFRKAGEESFFGAKENPVFFNAPVQAKLTVSSPDDPQEKEADAVADQVMRMSDPVVSGSDEKKEELLQREPEEGAEMPVLSYPTVTLNRKEDTAEESLQVMLFRQMEPQVNSCEACNAEEGEVPVDISRKAYNGAVLPNGHIQRNGRGPPTGLMNFEQSLSSSKGGGSAMSASSRQFMENRFGADFSGVRIHTGTQAESLSRSIQAQAFAHGNDIYFNSGKYAPGTAAGDVLLAHELTHTIQQGASRPHATASVANPSVARKNIIQRSTGGVPEQLTHAVEKAKTVEGKIDANKPQPDGNRTGWEHLVEIFKTTFGAEKIVSGSGASVKGAVAEQDIKKKRMQAGSLIVDKTTATDRNAIPKTTIGERDAMPSWCGIFVFWALNKSGVPMPKWKLGERMIKPEAARPPGVMPLPGDIAYRNAYSHFAIVESAAGGMIKTVNGNTAGEDNLGGQVQTIEHPVSDWTAFFDPLQIMEGSLGQGERSAEEKPKTLRELRRELFHVNRQADESFEEEGQNPAEKNTTNDEAAVQVKPELSSWQVNARGSLSGGPHTTMDPPAIQRQEEEKKEEDEKYTGTAIATQQKTLVPALDRKADTLLQEQEKEETTVSAKTETKTGAACGCEHKIDAKAISEQGRGPPAISLGQGSKIQCGWFDSALSYVNSAIDYVAEGLEAGKRLLLGEARDFAMAIPGYRALRVVLNEDPVTGEFVDRNGKNFIEAAFDIMPGGRLLHQKLNELGALDEAAAWIDTQIARVISLVSNISQRIDQFWNGITLGALANPTQIFENIGNIIHGFIQSVIGFAVEVAHELLEMVKRFLLTQLVNFVRDHTTAYPLLTVILEKDPITEARVLRNGANMLNAILELGGEEGRMQRTQMQETGTFTKVSDWIDRGIVVFGNLYETVRNNIGLIWDVVSIESLMDPVGTFNRIYDTFADPVTQVWNFVRDTAAVILQLIKEVLMRRLSAWAATVRGYTLVTVLIGRDPFTNERVPRTIPNIIRGFMSLMEGGEEQYQQMEQSGAIGRATQQINTAVARLNMTPAYIVQLFTSLWNSFSLNDLVHPVEAFQRIIDRFGEPIGRLIAFVAEIVKIVVRVILEIMNFPFDLIGNIIARAMAAFESIKRDPIGFLKNLLRAIKQGFIQFFGNIAQHLLQGLTGWLMSELRDAGVPELTDFTLRGVIGWVLDVLGISMEKIWEKLAAHPRIGPQRVARIRSMINTLEGIWTFIKDVQERGMAAIWERIQEQLSNLWETILSAVKNWVMEQIINRMVTRLLSMLDPTGIMAVINSAIAVYSAIQSFIRYLREMLEVVNSFVNGVADIAEGNVTTAANYLERTMGRAMPIVIGFLANQVGLSGIGRRVGEMIEVVREKVDEALTWLVNRAVDTGMNLLDRVMAMGRSARDAIVNALTPWRNADQSFTSESGEAHRIYIEQRGGQPVLIVASDPSPILRFLTYWETRPGITARQRDAVTEARNFYNTNVLPLMNEIKQSEDSGRPENEREPLLQRLGRQNMSLSEIVKRVLGSSTDLSGVRQRYALEGMTGQYSSMPEATGDDLEADHQPQNSILEHAAAKSCFNQPGVLNLRNRAANRSGLGRAINLHLNRHRAGRTHGSAPGSAANLARVRNDIDVVAASTDTDLNKRRRIVNILKAELAADVSRLTQVANRPFGGSSPDPVWADINSLGLSDPDRDTLGNEIKQAIVSGERQMAVQPMDNLVN